MFPVIDLEATARQIDTLRLERNLTVRDLQNVFGFSSPQAVYGWIRAKSVPSIDNLVVLANVLDTTIDDLIITQ
ncbi:MAG: helix-turn-helix transcriptional regulator [Oscillospiraceae bacterium]|nr:helix-turn-helix transcriptional regulator [Oscillospiraceae bacterium]